MGAVVEFDPAAFKVAFPEFTAAPDARCAIMFGLASSNLLDNTGGGPVNDPGELTNLFYLLVAHLLQLFGPAAPYKPGNRPPGRVAQATQGSVSSTFDYAIPAGSALAPWFAQTQYGAFYWTATARYRSARYFASGASGIGQARAYGAGPVYRPPGGV